MRRPVPERVWRFKDVGMNSNQEEKSQIQIYTKNKKFEGTVIKHNEREDMMLKV